MWGKFWKKNVMDIKIITVASEMTSNISKLNSNNFHPSIYMNSLRRHLSRIVIFPHLCTKSNLAAPFTHAIPETTRTFHFLDFYALRSFFLSFFYIEPTIFCVRCAWQMAKSGDFTWLQFHKGITCLFVCQASEQTNKEATTKATH